MSDRFELINTWYMKNTEKVKETILSAAATLFGRYGYEKTSVDQIAKLAHKAKTSIYYHFDSKLAIFKSCLETEFKNLMRRLERVREENSDNNGKRFALYLTTRMDLFLEMKVYKSYLCRLVPSLEVGEMKESVDSVRQKFDDYEYQFFHETAIAGALDGALTDAISPDAFAKMMIALFRGIEYQFFVTDDMEATRSTFGSLVDLIIYRISNKTVDISKSK